MRRLRWRERTRPAISIHGGTVCDAVLPGTLLAPSGLRSGRPRPEVPSYDANCCS